MNKSESKYFNTALLMDEALMQLLEKKDFEFITVKEICAKAGVNRSTFYLHYESTKDLLEECNDILLKNFNDKFVQNGINSININSSDLSDLIFINKEYLSPYLNYIKENLTTYKAIYKYPELFDSSKRYNGFYKSIFQPILSRFGVSKEDSAYMMEFFIKGTSAIVMKWVMDGCKVEIDKVIDLIIFCIRPTK